jgi:malonate transporter and related proteins
MLETLQIVLPIFLVIAMGYAAASTKLLGESVADGLSDFVFIIGIPVLLFRTLATAPLPETQPWFYWMAYFGGLTLAWIATSLVVSKVFGLEGQEVPIASFTAVQANTVFIGIPLVLRVFGEQGAAPVLLLIAVHLPLTMTVATLLIEKAENREGGFIALLKKVFLHPILVGILAGVAWRLTGLGLPAPIDAAAKLMGEAAVPTALFALGTTLSRYGFSAPAPLVGSMVLLKLIVHPALVYLLAFHVLPMPPLWAAVAVLVAACPSGVNAYLLAQRYNTGVAATAGTVAVSTALAVVTTTWWVWLVSGVK